MQHHIMAAACCVFVISLCFQFKTAVAFLLWANALITVGKACCNDWWSGLSESIQSGRFCLCGVFKSFGLTRIWESRRYIRYLSCWLKSQTEFQWPKCLQELPGVRTSETCFKFGSHFVWPSQLGLWPKSIPPVWSSRNSDCGAASNLDVCSFRAVALSCKNDSADQAAHLMAHNLSRVEHVTHPHPKKENKNTYSLPK